MPTPSNALKVTLTYGTYSLDVFRFPSTSNYSRNFIEVGNTEYSTAGNPTDTGSAYEYKHIWDMTFFMSTEEYQQLYLIFQAADTARRSFGDYRVTVDDYVQAFLETAPRSRAIAPGGSESFIGLGVEYPARYYARMFPPTAEKLLNPSLPYRVSLTLRELDKFVA